MTFESERGYEYLVTRVTVSSSSKTLGKNTSFGDGGIGARSPDAIAILGDWRGGDSIFGMGRIARFRGADAYS